MSIYRFTNVNNRQSYGVITELRDNGAYVLFDDFRINDKVLLVAHYAYVSFEPNPYVMDGGRTKREVLPDTTPVVWQDKRLAEVASHLVEGFAEWWAEHGPAICKDMYNIHYRKEQNS